MVRYLAKLSTGKVVLWCFLAWYLSTVVQHFDATPAIWLNALGISAIIGVVPGAEVGVAEPVVGDVDPLGALESGIAGDVGVVLAQERSPRELDDLGAGVDRDLEPGVQVVRGDRGAGRHAEILVVSSGAGR